MNEDELSRVRTVKDAHERELLRKPNVVGVGIGRKRRGGETTGQLSIIVSVSQKVPADSLEPDEVIPSDLEGIPVDVQEVGTLRAF
jgi:hypothetical protein